MNSNNGLIIDHTYFAEGEDALIAEMSAAVEELIGGLVRVTKHQFDDSDYLDKVWKGQYTFRRYTPSTNKMDWVATFILTPMPGCCGVCISTGAQVDWNYRHRGINTLLNKYRIKFARFLGYGILVCTVTSDNEYQIRTLEKNGWSRVTDFVNPRTDHKVVMYQYDLSKKEDK